MKMLILATMMTVFTSTAMASGGTYFTLVSQNDFGILTEVEDNKVHAFVSQAGPWVNKCGISIRTNNYNVLGKELKDVLSIHRGRVNNIEEVLNFDLVGQIMEGDDHMYGESFIIETKSGLSIKEELKSLSPHQKMDALVEILPCK
jgi:hypothetical protein